MNATVFARPYLQHQPRFVLYPRKRHPLVQAVARVKQFMRRNHVLPA